MTYQLCQCDERQDMKINCTFKNENLTGIRNEMLFISAETICVLIDQIRRTDAL